MIRRLAIVGVSHETNTYSSRPATLEAFQHLEHAVGEEILHRHEGTRSVIGGFLSVPGYEPVATFSAMAWPSGPAPTDVADHLLSQVSRQLELVGPVDGVLCNLHGAMVCENHPDMDADVIAEIRAAVGADVPIGAVVDLHANPSPRMIAMCDVLAGYRTYPHVDMHVRGARAARLVLSAVDGPRLRSVIAKVPLLSSPLSQATASSPMSELLREADRLQRQHGLRDVSLLPGFPYSDVDRAGFSIIAVSTEERVESANRVLQQLAEAVWVRRDDFTVEAPRPADAVRAALAATETPVVLADVADNVGAGGPGDGTALLRELLVQGADSALLTLCDARAVEAAHVYGPNHVIELDIGGHSDRLHGDPVHLAVAIRSLHDPRYRSEGAWMTGVDFNMGRAAVLEAEGVTIIATERPVPPFHGESVTALGIDPSKFRIIVAKGAVAWKMAFGSVARSAISVATPGVCPVDPRDLPRSTTPMSLIPTADLTS